MMFIQGLYTEGKVPLPDCYVFPDALGRILGLLSLAVVSVGIDGLLSLFG